MKIAVAAVAGLALSASALASDGPVVQTLPFGPNTPNFIETLTFNQHNPALGPLKQVRVTLSLNVAGGILELDNDGDQGANGNAELGANAAISSIDVPLLDIAFQPVTGTAAASNSSPFAIAGNDGDPAGTFEAGGPDYFVFNGAAGADVNVGDINPAFFGAYTGFGTFDVDVTSQQIFEYGAIGGIAFAGSPVTASGTVKIEYFYVIPGPSSAALLGLGGLLVARRRR